MEETLFMHILIVIQTEYDCKYYFKQVVPFDLNPVTNIFYLIFQIKLSNSFPDLKSDFRF